MKKLRISRGLEHRLKFKAADGTERHVFQVPHSMERLKERGRIPADFVDRKIRVAVNDIITKHKDQPTLRRGSSYFIIVKNPWVDPKTRRQHWLGFPFQWLNPKGDREVEQYTDKNFGKLITYIEKSNPVVPRHPGDITLKIASEYKIIEID